MMNSFRICEAVQAVLDERDYSMSEKKFLAEEEKKLGKAVDEKKWSEAKAKTKSQYGGGLQKTDPGKFYSISMGIYKTMMGESELETIKLKNHIEHVKDLIAKAPAEDKVKLREILKGEVAALKRAEGGKLDEAEEGDASWTGAPVEDEPADQNPAEDGKASEDGDDPTRDQLETSKDEADEKKGGPAELSADLRVIQH